MSGTMTGLGEGSTAERYRAMAERELRGISPSYERICRGVADDPELIACLEELPAPKRQPNLLLAAVRYAGGPVDAYPAFAEFAVREWDEISKIMMARRTQTNEVARCATLLPAFPSGPISLLEVGASAGLCLYPDRYAYRYDDKPVLGESSVVLECSTSGPVPAPSRLPEVVWRGGLDLNPLDVRDEVDLQWLQCLIWPEETDRFARLRAAVQIARNETPALTRGDLVTDLPAVAAAAPPDITLVIFHTAVLSYVDTAGRAAFATAVRDLARQRSVCWLSNEAPGVVAGTENEINAGGRARFVLARDGEPLARTDPHGKRLHWLG